MTPSPVLLGIDMNADVTEGTVPALGIDMDYPSLLPPSIHPPSQADDEYYIRDYDLMVSRYISVPRSYEPFNPGTLAAGMMRGMLDSAGFPSR